MFLPSCPTSSVALQGVPKITTTFPCGVCGLGFATLSKGYRCDGFVLSLFLWFGRYAADVL